jgi:hypothetical protein
MTGRYGPITLYSRLTGTRSVREGAILIIEDRSAGYLTGTLSDLTLQHTNHTVLVEGPEVMVRPVTTRRLVAGGSR